MTKEFALFSNFLRKRNLKLTKHREEILKVFLKTERHITVEELYNIIKKIPRNIGHTTVFRTLKLLRQAGIAREVDFGDKKTRYEHKYAHQHHDHLICTECSKSIEVVDSEIERLQDRLCKKVGFLPHRHKMEIFGICKKCKTKFKR